MLVNRLRSCRKRPITLEEKEEQEEGGEVVGRLWMELGGEGSKADKE